MRCKKITEAYIRGGETVLLTFYIYFFDELKKYLYTLKRPSTWVGKPVFNITGSPVAMEMVVSFCADYNQKAIKKIAKGELWPGFNPCIAHLKGCLICRLAYFLECAEIFSKENSNLYDLNLMKINTEDVLKKVELKILTQKSKMN